MMNRRTWIAGITVTSLLAALLTACKQEQREQEMRQTLPVMVVSSRAVEFQESYSASIRWAAGCGHSTPSVGPYHPPVCERRGAG